MNELLQDIKNLMNNGDQVESVNKCIDYFNEPKFRKHTGIYTSVEARQVILNKIYHELNNSALRKNKINELMNILQFINDYKNIYLVNIGSNFVPLSFDILKQDIKATK